jgi:hypothetical protein
MNTVLFKLQMVNDFLAELQQHRQILLNELVDNATDPVIRKRRFRMLSNLATFEASVIKKISEFETDNIHDLFSVEIIVKELELLLDRSA